MTPTQSNDTTSREDELRADIERHLRHYKYYHANSPKGMSDKEANDFLIDYIKQYGDQIHNELTGNDKKVWLYKEDFERRLIQERIDELDGLYRTDVGLNRKIVTEPTIEKRKAELTALKEKGKE